MADLDNILEHFWCSIGDAGDLKKTLNNWQGRESNLDYNILGVLFGQYG